MYEHGEADGRHSVRPTTAPAVSADFSTKVLPPSRIKPQQQGSEAVGSEAEATARSFRNLIGILHFD
jgi:hypothetical protein